MKQCIKQYHPPSQLLAKPSSLTNSHGEIMLYRRKVQMDPVGLEIYEEERSKFIR